MHQPIRTRTTRKTAEKVSKITCEATIWEVQQWFLLFSVAAHDRKDDSLFGSIATAIFDKLQWWNCFGLTIGSSKTLPFFLFSLTTKEQQDIHFRSCVYKHSASSHFLSQRSESPDCPDFEIGKSWFSLLWEVWVPTRAHLNSCTSQVATFAEIDMYFLLSNFYSFSWFFHWLVVYMLDRKGSATTSSQWCSKCICLIWTLPNLGSLRLLAQTSLSPENFCSEQ